MSAELSRVKIGLALVLLGLFLNVSLGVTFGVNEDAYKDFIAEGIEAHPAVHDEKSQDKIWRYAQRAHFHAGGVSTFCLALIILVMFSKLTPGMKNAASILLGLGSFYPLAWLSMFFLSPSLGRDAAHEHILTETFTYIGVGGILLGSIILVGNLFFGLFGETADA